MKVIFEEGLFLELGVETVVSRRMNDEEAAAASRVGEAGELQAEEHDVHVGEPQGVGSEEEGAHFVSHFVEWGSEEVAEFVYHFVKRDQSNEL